MKSREKLVSVKHPDMHLSTNTHAFYIQPHDSHFHNLLIIALHLISPLFTVAAHRTFKAFWCLVGVEVKSIGSEMSLNSIFTTSWLCDQGMWLPIMFMWLNLFVYKVGIIPSVLRINSVSHMFSKYLHIIYLEVPSTEIAVQLKTFPHIILLKQCCITFFWFFQIYIGQKLD